MKKNKIATAFIIAMLVVSLVFGIWAGVAYLTFEDYHLMPVDGELRERTRTEGVVYHHTAASDRPITSHHRYHLTRGWLMAGYHYQIRTDGTIEIGRPHETVGAHAGASANGHTIGIALSGNMEHYPPTDEQYSAVIDLHYWLENDEGAGYGELEIWGHYDFMNTSCPGKYTDLDIIREGVEMLRLEGLKDDKLSKPSDPKFKIIDVEVLEGYVQGKLIESYLVIEEGRNYVPIRFVSEELGYDVEWDAENRVWYVD